MIPKISAFLMCLLMSTPKLQCWMLQRVLQTAAEMKYPIQSRSTFPGATWEEKGVEFARTWKEMTERLYTLDQMLGLLEATRSVYRSDFTSAGTQLKFLLALTWSRNDLQPTGFHTSICISLNVESSYP